MKSTTNTSDILRRNKKFSLFHLRHYSHFVLVVNSKPTVIFLIFYRAFCSQDMRLISSIVYLIPGNWDLVGNNTPIFFIRDPILFPSFIHTQKRNPVTHLKDPDAMWDFITLRPETTHQVTQRTKVTSSVI